MFVFIDVLSTEKKAMVCKYSITLNHQHYALNILLLNSLHNIPTRGYLSSPSPPSVCLIVRLSLRLLFYNIMET